MAEFGRFLLVAGALLVAVGLLLVIYSRVPGPSGIGRLPGDFYVDRPNFRLYVPLGTCLLVSVVLTLVCSLFRR